MSAWKKVGHRSVKHIGEPKMVVRFTKGRGKLKLLGTSGVPYTVSELCAFVAEAEAFWKGLKQTN